MNPINNNILEIIRNGEDSEVEFKLEAVNLESLTQEIVAFANMTGGLILMGVNDDGQIKGVKNLKKLEELIINICRNNIKPPIIPIINKFKIDNKVIIGIKVSKSNIVVSTLKGQYFIRIGSTKQIPTSFELARLFQKSQMLNIDEILVYDSEIEYLDLKKIDSYLNRLNQPLLNESRLPLNDLLKNMKIIKQEENNFYPTLAGLLTFGKNPQHLLNYTSITAAFYKGTDKISKILDQKEIEGTLDELIDEGCKFVEKNMRVGAEIKDMIREDLPDYSILAIREALTNAVAHRDYSITGSNIKLFVFEDRCEIISPGNLPNTMTLENIKTLQFARNQLIVSFLVGFKRMEKRGEGILRIIKYSIENNSKDPVFDLIDNNYFRVILFKRDNV